MKVAVLGAGGFVGRALIEKCDHSELEIEWVAIQRSKPSGQILKLAEWRSCDLLDPIQANIALAGIDIAVYLVHSMAPSGIELQGSFQDIDALIALNIAEAAQAQGVKKIIYLGGLIPEGKKLSEHLESRLEVEKILQTSGCQVISLRAGLIIGHGGSSFELMSRLVKRLPVMLCPSWTASLTEAVALVDVTRAIVQVMSMKTPGNHVFDLGSGEKISYRDLMKVTARLMGIERQFFAIPAVYPGLSVLWISLITKAKPELVRPLVHSLTSSMIPRERHRFPFKLSVTSLAEAISQSLQQEAKTPSAESRPRRKRQAHWGFQTRIVSRLPFVEQMSALDLGRKYFEWLGQFLPGLIRIQKVSEDHYRIFLGPLTKAFLVLNRQPQQERPGMALFEIEQGILVRKNLIATEAEALQSFNFRKSNEAGLALGVIENYQPRLPRWTYTATQAVAHKFVMRFFSKALARESLIRYSLDRKSMDRKSLDQKSQTPEFPLR